MMRTAILALDSPDATLELAGGQGANLAALIRAGFDVPTGFLGATCAYTAFVEANGLRHAVLDDAAAASAADPAALEAASTHIRERFEASAMPEPMAREIRDAYAALGAGPVAVRSSATAEDLPEMSFAGQQDTFLNVVGDAALLDAVVRCWSSLWTARAIGYRTRNGLAHDAVALAVVVQEMVPSDASGVLFTANPLTGNRTEIVVDATFGLGEALVSGLVEPDHYVVDDDRVVSKTLGAKALAIEPVAGGGTRQISLEGARHQAISDDAVVELSRTGRKIEALFGSPQDIEWALKGNELWLLQSRPITSLGNRPDPDAPRAGS